MEHGALDIHDAAAWDDSALVAAYDAAIEKYEESHGGGSSARTTAHGQSALAERWRTVAVVWRHGHSQVGDGALRSETLRRGASAATTTVSG